MRIKATQHTPEPKFEPVTIEIVLDSKLELKALKEFSYFTGTMPSVFRDELDKDESLADSEKKMSCNIVGNILRELHYQLSPLTRKNPY